MKKFTFLVESEFNGYKIKDYLKRKIGLSEVIIKQIKYGGVRVNGEVVNMIKILHSRDEIEIILPPETPNEFATAKKFPLKILFEDDYFLAVFKPCGMPTHNSKGFSGTTLQEAVLGYFLPEKAVYRAINRLDRDTAGIVIIAKDHVSASLMGNEMKKGNFLKRYRALVCGKMENSHGVIDLPIDRERLDGQKRIVSQLGKRAITEYFVERELENNLTLLSIVLHTGRTHQIRVHLAHVGHPLYADFLYGERVENQTYYLVANHVEFTHPFTKEKIVIKTND